MHAQAIKGALLALGVILTTGLHADDPEPTREELMQRLEAMSRELESTKAALRASEQKRIAAEKAAQTPASERIGVLEEQIAKAADMGPAKVTPGDIFPVLEGLKIGGAVRANYTLGDYSQDPPNRFRDSSGTRGGSGTIALDTFRINLDYERGNWTGKGEYRFYPGYAGNNADTYHFAHTAWIGYNFENGDQLQAGLNRTPFGPGPFGVSQSWLFDQHYYVGLSDNMNVGFKYTTDRVENWKFDFAYYAVPTPNGTGKNFSRDSVRYSYDVVDETGDGYEESHQFNIRGVYSTQLGKVNADLGSSLQYGVLESNGPQSDGDMFAGSVHAILKFGNWTLAPQLTYYHYNVEANDDRGGNLLSDKVVQMGAYDFPSLVAAEAWIPAVSLSYYHETPQFDWLDYIIPYIEYSALIKAENDFNDSEMFILGSAFARGGWYIYTDLAFSNGNDFVGNRSGFGDTSEQVDLDFDNGFFSSNRLGANPTDEWETRFNINFGYYF